ncbi:putative protein OS=Bosea thiooxidans OX=53254 GN=SAMN05660750_04015 PE=4 SV=1 [Bosea thiooxidans]|uniref:Uncharacterized protein n=1 Tax=Bosea thiooxidans TaxID=53254 RepID=A0A1T5GEW4_9HYPH|nr:hypothetical protein SAMN05660750_04015 [Bosea thiooxidans]
MQSRSRRGAHRSPFTCLINAPFELQYIDFELVCFGVQVWL